MWLKFEYQNERLYFKFESYFHVEPEPLDLLFVGLVLFACIFVFLGVSLAFVLCALLLFGALPAATLLLVFGVDFVDFLSRADFGYFALFFVGKLTGNDVGKLSLCLHLALRCGSDLGVLIDVNIRANGCNRQSRLLFLAYYSARTLKLRGDSLALFAEIFDCVEQKREEDAKN